VCHTPIIRYAGISPSGKPLAQDRP